MPSKIEVRVGPEGTRKLSWHFSSKNFVVENNCYVSKF